MSTFSTTRRYEISSSFIPQAVDAIKNSFEAEGFTFSYKPSAYNKTVIEVTKGNLVKKIVGLRQGLEIVFEKDGSDVVVTAMGTVLKDQLIASSITLLITWPVLIPQIIGLIIQSGLDDKAMGIIDTAHARFCSEHPTFCTHCGGRLVDNPEVCPHCGTQL